MQQIVTGEKIALNKTAVHQNVPSVWPELSIKKLMKDIKDSQSIMMYLPAYEEGKRFVDRDFFWKVLYAVRPALANDLVADAIQHRVQLRR